METEAESPNAAPVAPATRRILVVDDNEGLRRLVSRALGIEGIEVDEASDGDEGLRRALASRYDVVVLDLQLPKLDGMAVLRQLLSARPDQVVVVCSCSSDRKTRSECARTGARGFLAKPFSIIDLVTAVVGPVRVTSAYRRRDT